MKLAFADRARWLGDPDQAKVPRGLLSASYLRSLGEGLRMDRAADIGRAGSPPDAESDIFRRHTTHFSVCDAAGWWVAATATINTTFGSKVIVPGTGVVLNNEMDDFSAQPGAANAFGLVGAEANAVAPGKRPLSSMSPTIVCSGGEPMLALGAAGGPTIISQTLLHLVGLMDLGLAADKALQQPRMHHQWKPDQLMLESAFPAEIAEELVRRGHKIKKGNVFGVSQITARGSDGVMTAAADPRASGSGLVW
jgi:gamma-glutamyltranspeptidase/glutathione hydrolase